MTFYKRAIASITRNIGKTCVLFLIILVLGSVISGAISTNQATENLQHNLIDRMLPLATIELDWDTFVELHPEEFFTPTLSPDEIRAVGNLPYVKTYDFFTNSYLYVELTKYVMPDEDGSTMGGGGGASDYDEPFGPLMNVRGVQYHNLTDAEQGLIEVVAGRTFTSEEIDSISSGVLISEEIARLNNLSVGSTITFRNLIIDYSMGMDENETSARESIFDEQSYDKEVIGIFGLTSEHYHDDPEENKSIITDLQNRIYASNTFVEMALNFEHEAYVRLNPETAEFMPDDVYRENFFVLHDPNYFEEFGEATRSIVPEYYMVKDTSLASAPVLSALDTMRGLTTTVLMVAVAASLLILTLLITLFLRDRKREIGLYLALGERKRNIIGQFLTEIMSVAFVAIVVALFIGSIIASGLSESMLMDDIALEQEYAQEAGTAYDNTFANKGFQTDPSIETIAYGYDVSLSPLAILIFFGVGLGTVLLATVVPMIYVLRLNPKKIML